MVEKFKFISHATKISKLLTPLIFPISGWGINFWTNTLNFFSPMLFTWNWTDNFKLRRNYLTQTLQQDFALFKPGFEEKQSLLPSIFIPRHPRFSWKRNQFSSVIPVETHRLALWRNFQMTERKVWWHKDLQSSMYLSAASDYTL